MGESIFLSQKNKGVKTQQNYTQILSTVLDKLYEYLLALATSNGQDTPHSQIKLRRIMDILGEQMFRAHIDSQGRGHCYGFEIFEYMKSPNFVFHGIHLTEEELSVFMRFVGQVAAMNLEEAGSVMKSQIKWSFLLAQLEQNFYIRITTTTATNY